MSAPRALPAVPHRACDPHDRCRTAGAAQGPGATRPRLLERALASPDVPRPPRTPQQHHEPPLVHQPLRQPPPAMQSATGGAPRRARVYDRLEGQEPMLQAPQRFAQVDVAAQSLRPGEWAGGWCRLPQGRNRGTLPPAVASACRRLSPAAPTCPCSPPLHCCPPHPHTPSIHPPSGAVVALSSECDELLAARRIESGAWSLATLTTDWSSRGAAGGMPGVGMQCVQGLAWPLRPPAALLSRPCTLSACPPNRTPCLAAGATGWHTHACDYAVESLEPFALFRVLRDGRRIALASLAADGHLLAACSGGDRLTLAPCRAGESWSAAAAAWEQREGAICNTRWPDKARACRVA